MRAYEKESLSMLCETPSYDGDDADSLKLEEAEECMVEERMTSIKIRNPERQPSRGDGHRVPECHKTKHQQAQPSCYPRENIQLEEWLKQEHRHERLWGPKQHKT